MQENPQNNLRAEFNSLTNDEQQIVANYLNLHNACVFYYHSILSDSCKEFVSHAIMIAEEAASVESLPEDELDS